MRGTKRIRDVAPGARRPSDASSASSTRRCASTSTWKRRSTRSAACRRTRRDDARASRSAASSSTRKRCAKDGARAGSSAPPSTPLRRAPAAQDAGLHHRGHPDAGVRHRRQCRRVQRRERRAAPSARVPRCRPHRVHRPPHAWRRAARAAAEFVARRTSCTRRAAAASTRWRCTRRGRAASPGGDGAARMGRRRRRDAHACSTCFAYRPRSAARSPRGGSARRTAGGHHQPRALAPAVRR